jgi:multidrug efflux pump subunit AcrA (membrane-fusion protein)
MSYTYQRGDLPLLPPGVSTFDPRRFRRHARKAQVMHALQSAKREKVVAEHEKRVALQRVAQAERERMKAQAQLAREQGKGFWGRVRDVFRRRAF